MRRERKAYLWDILDAIHSVQGFMRDAAANEHFGGDLLQATVERKLEIIGEAMKQMEARFPGSTAKLPDVKLAMGMRDWLAHGYFAVQPELLWSTVSDNPPQLKSAVEAVLNVPESTETA